MGRIWLAVMLWATGVGFICMVCACVLLESVVNILTIRRFRVEMWIFVVPWKMERQAGPGLACQCLPFVLYTPHHALFLSLYFNIIELRVRWSIYFIPVFVNVFLRRYPSVLLDARSLLKHVNLWPLLARYEPEVWVQNYCKVHL